MFPPNQSMIHTSSILSFIFYWKCTPNCNAQCAILSNVILLKKNIPKYNPHCVNSIVCLTLEWKNPKHKSWYYHFQFCQTLKRQYFSSSPSIASFGSSSVVIRWYAWEDPHRGSFQIHEHKTIEGIFCKRPCHWTWFLLSMWTSPNPGALLTYFLQ